MRNLSRLDFIPRDLAYAGTIGITLDVDSLVSAADAEHPDWKLLGSLSNYMSENIYESLPGQCASTMYQRALAALLLQEKVTLEKLFGMDPETALDDDQLKAVIARTRAGKQVFDDAIREGWHVWPIKTYVDAGLPKISSDNLAHALYEGLVDRECTHGLLAAVARLSKLGLAAESLKGAAEIVNRRATSGEASEGEMSIQVGEFAYPFRGDLYEFQINAMHAAISGDETVRKNLGWKVEDAAEVLWGQLMQWQSLYFGGRSTKTIAILLESAQTLLAKQVVAGASNAETELELYTLLEALKHPSNTISFRYAETRRVECKR